MGPAGMIDLTGGFLEPTLWECFLFVVWDPEDQLLSLHRPVRGWDRCLFGRHTGQACPGKDSSLTIEFPHVDNLGERVVSVDFENLRWAEVL